MPETVGLRPMDAAYIKFESDWKETDLLLDVTVTFAGRGYVVWQRSCIDPAQLLAFAARLRDFPASLSDEVTLEAGSTDPKMLEWLRLRAFVADGVGHCGLEFSSNTNGTPLAASRFRYAMPIEAASLNELGARLAAWVKAPDSELHFEPNSG